LVVPVTKAAIAAILPKKVRRVLVSIEFPICSVIGLADGLSAIPWTLSGRGPEQIVE